MLPGATGVAGFALLGSALSAAFEFASFGTAVCAALFASDWIAPCWDFTIGGAGGLAASPVPSAEDCVLFFGVSGNGGRGTASASGVESTNEGIVGSLASQSRSACTCR